MIFAETIGIGDELLSGLTLNTNSVFIAQELEALGIMTRWQTTVGDDLDDIRDALDRALSRADVVTLTGGLGPTHDDMTKKALCNYFHVDLKFYPEILEKIKKRFERRGYKLPKINENQAEYPANAELLHNSAGSAQGMAFQVGEKVVYSMPGVPREMRAIMLEEIIPRLKDRTSTRVLRVRVHTTGVPESRLYESIHHIFRDKPDLKVAYLPKHTGVTIRLSLFAEDAKAGRSELDATVNQLRQLLPKAIYGVNEDTLPAVVGELLRQLNAKVTTAESCTGGLIANMLTDVSGSSDYFEAGYVTYANRVKHGVLDVPLEVLESEGAVSEATVKAMLSGALSISGADYAVAVSGIAGPTGGTEDKPVGMVYIGVGRKDDFTVKRFQFGQDRVMNKEMTAMAALNLLRLKLLADATQ
ncbi:MAG: competence/damage-inducible protein A [Lentisphaeria bacterium]|nr:competence/damage-inducible protein A [Candidatus Neomarinimicrobiota bacterium]MCF7841384.1 competence/damage-inducible protein A [Lentisphaeria bacterium]